MKLLPEVSQAMLSQLYKETNILLVQAGKLYLVEDGDLVRAYNKTKHGFVIVSDEYVSQFDKHTTIHSEGCWIVTDNPAYNMDKNAKHNAIQLFLVDESLTKPLIQRIGEIRGAVMTLCELTAQLLEQDVITTGNDKL